MWRNFILLIALIFTTQLAFAEKYLQETTIKDSLSFLQSTTPVAKIGVGSIYNDADRPKWVDETGNVFVDKELIPSRELLSRLKREQSAFPEKTAVISGHRESPYRIFVDVLDKVRLAGFQRLSMEAEPMPLEHPPVPAEPDPLEDW